MRRPAWQELDLKVGVAFTRFQTRFFQGRYANLDSALISYGPCQTPTLGFCVERHLQIQEFAPEPFWRVDVVARTESGVGGALDLQWARGRLFDKPVAAMYRDAVAEQRVATVREVREEGERVRDRTRA